MKRGFHSGLCKFMLGIGWAIVVADMLASFFLKQHNADMFNFGVSLFIVASFPLLLSALAEKRDAAEAPAEKEKAPASVKKSRWSFVSTLIVGIVFGVILVLIVGISLIKMIGSPTPIKLELPDKPFRSVDELTGFLDKSPYEVGFFSKNLKTGKTVARFADRQVCLASIVKIFCLTELYRQRHEEGLDLERKIGVPNHGSITLSKAADLMIGLSDNSATQALAEFLGRDKVNAIPALLGIDSMAAQILPDSETLGKVLDKRIYGERIGPNGLPQHGTARGTAHYFELLMNRKVISEEISSDIISFFSKHPKPFSHQYADKYEFFGKGGNLLWTRPSKTWSILSMKHYSMLGWGLCIKNISGEYIALCAWGEWFPRNVPPESQSEYLKFVTDSVISIIEKE